MNTINSSHDQVALQFLKAHFDAEKQQKWAVAYADELVMKTKLMNVTFATTRMVQDANKFLSGPRVYTSAEQNAPIHALIDSVKSLAKKNIKMEVANFSLKKLAVMAAPVEQLEAAMLTNKRAVLRAVPLINVQVGAAFLGMTTAALYDLLYKSNGLLGDYYASAYCLSIDELFLIAENPNWLHDGDQRNEPSDTVLPDDRAFDHVLFVGETVACAFLDLTPSELGRQVQRSANRRRPYRLADLEKIRTEKMAQPLA